MRSSIVLKIAGTQLLELIVGLPIAIIFWPVLLYFWTSLKLVRFTVQRFLNWTHRNSCENKGGLPGSSLHDPNPNIVEYELASGSDSIFGYKVKNNCNSVIPGFCVIKGKFDVDLITRRVGQMADGNPKLRQRFSKKLGFFCWEKNESAFNIENHVKLITKPEHVVDEASLMTIMEKLSVTEINSDFPMWELLLIPSFRTSSEGPNDPIQHFAQILRVHHAYGDGISFCLTSNAYLFDEPATLPLDPKKGFPVPGWMLFIQYVKVVLLGPFYFLINVITFTQDQSKFSVVGDYAPTKFMSRSATPVKLSTLKEIKTKANVSVTAILISAICSSLRNTHKKLYPSDQIPKILNTANVNAILPYTNDQIQNRFTIFPFAAPFAPISNNDNDDSASNEEQGKESRMKQLERTNEEGYRVTMSPDPIFCHFMIKVVGDLPAFMQDFLLGLSGTPCMLSNIPGIVDTVKVFNGSVIDSGAWLPLIRVTGIAVATYTYRGELRFCGIGDPTVFPQRSDLEHFLNGITNEVQRLYQDRENLQERRQNRKIQQKQQQQQEDEEKERKPEDRQRAVSIPLLDEVTSSYRKYLRSKQA